MGPHDIQEKALFILVRPRPKYIVIIVICKIALPLCTAVVYTCRRTHTHTHTLFSQYQCVCCAVRLARLWWWCHAALRWNENDGGGGGCHTACPNRHWLSQCLFVFDLPLPVHKYYTFFITYYNYYLMFIGSWAPPFYSVSIGFYMPVFGALFVCLFANFFSRTV